MIRLNVSSPVFHRNIILTIRFPVLFIFLAISCLTYSTAAAHNAITERENTRPLNVLLITSDDQCLQAGCYGDTLAETPRIDRLASEGVLFTRAYVTQASCSPSRGSILTGLYPHQNGQIGLAGHHPEYRVHDGIPILPDLLKDAGYRTGIIGKLHVSPADMFRFDYDQRNANDTEETRRDVERIAGFAGDFISDSAGAPFFLYVNFFDPHRPYDQNAYQFKGLPENPYTPGEVKPFSYLGLDGPPVRQEVAGYYNCLNRLDAGIGMLMDRLVEAGEYDHTLIIFLGDHGVPFTRAKTTCYEAATSVPFIVKWPGADQAGYVCNEFVSSVDIMPTILDAIGTACPEVAGRSLRPLVEGTTPGDWRHSLFTEYTSHGAQHFYPRRAVRNHRYKLIHNIDHARPNPVPFIGTTRIKAGVIQDPVVKEAYITNQDPPEWELYDLSSDPYELKNIAEYTAYQDILGELREELLDWRKESGDPLLDPGELSRLRQAHGFE